MNLFYAFFILKFNLKIKCLFLTLLELLSNSKTGFNFISSDEKITNNTQSFEKLFSFFRFFLRFHSFCSKIRHTLY